jgi:hypothetical protein
MKDSLPVQRGNVSLTNLQVLNSILYVAEQDAGDAGFSVLGLSAGPHTGTNVSTIAADQCGAARTTVDTAQCYSARDNSLMMVTQSETWPAMALGYPWVVY